MTDIRRQLDQVVSKELARSIIPVKTDAGILVGNILIVSEGSIKQLHRHGELLYNNISLNAVAVKMANVLARNRASVFADKLYGLDQDYSKWFTDSQNLLKNYYNAKKSKDFERADMLWARYCQSRDKAALAKDLVTGLTLF
jgi:hypothetical protein